MGACGDCGMVVEPDGAFHPHLFCVLVKAGRRDPWTDFAFAVTRLLDIELPSRPPLVRDLPIRLTGSRGSDA